MKQHFEECGKEKEKKNEKNIFLIFALKKRFYKNVKVKRFNKNMEKKKSGVKEKCKKEEKKKKDGKKKR